MPPRRLRWVRARLAFVAGVMTLGFFALLGKAYEIQIERGDELRALGHAQYLKEMKLTAPRGSIRDINGVDLAVTVEVDSVVANPRAVTNVARSADLLAGILRMDVRDVEARLSTDRYFAWIKRRVSPDEARRVREAKLAGVFLVKEPKRFYPQRGLAGPLLGFAGIDGQGLEGVELSLDEDLRGEPMILPAFRDARGQMLLADRPERALSSGAAVTLTVDRYIQFITERALRESIEENKAKAGVAIVMDPWTGEIRALASWPTYDPNRPSRVGEARNRAVTDAHEPGSVMKAFTIAAALDAGIITPESWIDIEGGKLRLGRKVYRDTHKGDYNVQITDVVKYSSNVGAIKIARRAGRETLHDFLVRLGFGKRTGVRLPGERSGFLRDPDRWGETGLASMSMGYGMTATPLQVARALSAIANGGTLHEPALVKRVEVPRHSGDGMRTTYEHEPRGERVMKEETARAMATMLRAVLEPGGTGGKLDLGGFTGAGKTGTAHKVDPATRAYAPDRYLSSFIGFAPADEPRLVVVVMIDEPRGDKYFGGAVAGPVFARIVQESLKYLGVESSGEPPPDAAARPDPILAAPALELPPLDAVVDVTELPPAGPGQPIVMIPDFRGMSMAQAIATARQAGVTLELEGSGRAVQQFPEPGRAMKSVTCRVTFAN